MSARDSGIRRISRGAAVVAAAGLALTGAAAVSAADQAPARGQEAAAHQAGTTAGSVSRGRVIDRAKAWAEAKVPYSMSDYRNDYRTDCSGYVSMAWMLGDSLTTVTLPEVTTAIGKEDLRAGDIMGKLGPGTGGSAGHVFLFDRWEDKSAGKFLAYEQTPPHTVHSHKTYSSLIDEGYKAYRYDKITD
ncbi:hypothetical protein CFN78_19490 [Amycolatopsis antarctica]|uniref:NlpC/P60 domain-containing protein n=1 Tax=Amycolatopsis antarctica TaxID=1854586 RepID=A0A263CZU5_9PSEU|nr:hypothetical protein [Amycolatopsis antarctica]OZM71693.1 hypothetical protein CFN78_19490 [Amycolatopsis antarctica]